MAESQQMLAMDKFPFNPTQDFESLRFSKKDTLIHSEMGDILQLGEFLEIPHKLLLTKTHQLKLETTQIQKQN